MSDNLYFRNRRQYQEVIARSEIEDKILDLIYNHDGYTTSDLQAKVSMLVIEATKL